jgi:translation initiation factor IF-3
LRNWRKNPITKRKTDELVNENIRFKEVLVIGPEGEQLGVMSRRDALTAAFDAELDLFCVAPQGNPPVCKILDYGRFKFEAQKKAKEAKKHQHQVEIKPLRLSPVIDTHDFETKLKQAREFLNEGNKVKLDMRFKGRMMTRIEVGTKVMNDFAEAVKDLANVDKAPVMEGRTMSVILTPIKKK